jgi:hypothetical protein
MMQSRILVAAATAGIAVLFVAPSVTTATPITPNSSSAVTAVAELANGMETVARRYYRPRYGYRYHRYRHRYAHRCWNCGGYGYGYGGPSFYLGLGIPFFYGGYYGSPYYDDYYYRYPRYYRGYYRYPRYYGGYYGGSSVWYGGKRN